MGFSCCACRKPFEGVPASEKGGGDSRDQIPAQPVSAIVKCGHLFHTDCLKKMFESQSGNAWVPKTCPACGNVVTAHDVIRVHASSFDARSNQRPRIEELMMEKKKLMDNYECLRKRFEMLRSQIGEKNVDIETIKRQKEELGLRLDQVCRLNSIHKADIERYRTEIDKLKNIIITLTGKLTGITGNDYTLNELYGPAPGSSSNGMNVNCRLEYTEELQRMSVYDSTATLSQNVMNGSLEKPTHHHPPGFMHRIPFPMENGSDGQDFDRASQAMGGSPEIQKIFENAAAASMPVRGNEVIIIPGTNHQHVRLFAQDIQVGNFDTNNNNSGLVQQHTLEESFPKMSNNLIPKENGSLSASAQYPSTTAPKSIAEKSEAHLISSSKKGDKGNDFVEVEDVVGNWHEKKSRRRTSSKSSGNGTVGPRERNSGRYDHLSDKKLLYGSFLCPTCNAKWGSSQSVLNTSQTCRICKTEVHPYDQGPILSRRALEMTKHASNNTSSKVSAKEKKKPSS